MSGNIQADETAAAKKRTRRGTWKDWENCEKALRSIEAGLGHFPSDKELFALGYGGLRWAVQKYHGGFNASRARCGAEILHVVESPWKHLGRVHDDLRRIHGELGHFPTGKCLMGLGEYGLLNGIGKFHGGLNAVRRSMDVSVVKNSNGHWHSRGNVDAAARSLIASVGRFPRYSDFESNGRMDLYIGIRLHHGGLPAVRDRLGYGPVTDETIASHADALAKIVPTLGANPTVLWSRMKRSWTVRDLDSAVAAHTTTGSLDAFRRLLDGTTIPPRD